MLCKIKYPREITQDKIKQMKEMMRRTYTLKNNSSSNQKSAPRTNRNKPEISISQNSYHEFNSNKKRHLSINSEAKAHFNMSPLLPQRLREQPTLTKYANLSSSGSDKSAQSVRSYQHMFFGRNKSMGNRSRVPQINKSKSVEHMKPRYS